MLGLVNRHEWRFTVAPDDPETYLKKEDGGDHDPISRTKIRINEEELP